MAAGCVFCEIVKGRSPAHVVGENRRAVAILDIFPWAAGHTLILSKRHVPFWHQADARGSVGRLLAGASRRAGGSRRRSIRSSCCLMARGRRIPHTHVFLGADAAGRRARPAVQRDGEDPGGVGGTGAAEEAFLPSECREEDSTEATEVDPSRSLRMTRRTSGLVILREAKKDLRQKYRCFLHDTGPVVGVAVVRRQAAPRRRATTSGSGGAMSRRGSPSGGSARSGSCQLSHHSWTIVPMS